MQKKPTILRTEFKKGQMSECARHLEKEPTNLGKLVNGDSTMPGNLAFAILKYLKKPKKDFAKYFVQATKQGRFYAKYQ